MGEPLTTPVPRGGRSSAPGWRRWPVLRRLLVRLAGAVGVLWAVVTLVFFALRAVPGDPAEAIMGGPGSQASQAALDRVREEYALNRPLLVQYLLQLRRTVTGQWGDSYSLNRPVVSLIREQIGGTLLLAVLALILAWTLALLFAAWSVRSPLGARLSSGLEIAASAMPHFWLGALLIMVFSTGLGWLPAISTGSADALILPVITLAVPVAGFLGQVMRESLLNADASPFALTARAHGLSETGVLLRHTLAHAALPALSLTGWAFGSLMSGAVVVENVFARPGLGRLLMGAVLKRDMPLVTGVVLVIAIVYVLVTLIADTLEGLFLPEAAA
ncbi:MAG: ABC transporter permease [Microbacteriaceae bacterium]|nr:ABC transporter permease [Microbacteriaceae bacterium]MCI1206884.1 ABC transporter permease [Microbacteriaceae bacterium]